MTLIVEPSEHLNHLSATNTQEVGFFFYLITAGYKFKITLGEVYSRYKQPKPLP